MDHKTWLWRKKPSEKTILATDKTDQNEEEVTGFLFSVTSERNISSLKFQLLFMSSYMMIMCSLSSQKEVHLESLVKNLNETLTSVLRDSNTKDDLVAKHEKRAQDAIAGDYSFFFVSVND